MKFTSMLLSLTGFVVLTGCETPSPSLLSLNPVATEQESKIDLALVGTWEGVDDHNVLCIVRPDDHAGYEIVVLGGSTPLAFKAQMFRIGDVEFLDVVSSGSDDFTVPGHAIARIWPTGMGLRWAFLDSDWLKQQAAQLAPHIAEGKTLLLSPDAVVRAFIVANGADEKAYGKVANWQRLQ